MVKSVPLPGHKCKSMEVVRLEKIMGRFSRDYMMLAVEQGIPQDLICLHTMPPQDVITSEKGAGKDTQKKIMR